MNYYADETEWKWLFKNAIDWDTIIPLYFPSYPTADGIESKEELISFFEEVVTSTGAWTANDVARRAEKLDRSGAGTIKDGRTYPDEALLALYREAAELGAIGLPFPTELGGMGLPQCLGMIFFSQLSRACMSSATQMAFFTSIGEMIIRFCDEETVKRLVPKIAAGEISGSMCLTEPGCGSDLGMIKTSATMAEDGKYLLNGSKIFITNGGGGLAFALARIKGEPEGLSGISMFLIEQDLPGMAEPNYRVTKAEEKMGMHGSFTCEVVYENSIATLVGEKNKGFSYMLHLMNEARIAVGMQALGTMEGSLGYAVKYAEERIQFDRPLSELPLMKRNLSDYTTERDAFRALIIDTASYFDIYQKLDNKKSNSGALSKEEQRLHKDAMLWTRKRTPLVKYYGCEAATHLSQRAIQVLGGYGFMKEYPVERYHRDSFGPLLYEGTSQIQALMALKDVVKFAMKDPKKFFRNIFLSHSGGTKLDASNPCTKAFKKIHYKFNKRMLALLLKTLRPEGSKMLTLKNWTKDESISNLMEHAETLCQGMSYLETLRVLCQHANKDQTRSDLFNRYSVLVAPRFEAIFKDWEIRS